MGLLIAGDIGGTKTILRLVETNDGKTLSTQYENQYISNEFPDLVPIVQQFLQTATTVLGYNTQPTKACLAIAGPVINHSSILTNLNWPQLTTSRLKQELGIAQVSLINDFVAIGYGVGILPETDLFTLQSGELNPDAPIAILGAGTGLGEGFAISQGNSYRVYGTEGGHADFAPRSEIEFQLLQYLRHQYKLQRVSVERIVCGQGIIWIYQFLRDINFAVESPEIQAIVKTWEMESRETNKSVDPAAAISAAALAKSDRLSEQAMQIFIEAYGAEAGNLALKLLPYGGLYVAGGIVTKILPLIQEGSFLKAFTQKGRMSNLLKNIPVHIVRNPQVGLIGAAAHAAKLN